MKNLFSEIWMWITLLVDFFIIAGCIKLGFESKTGSTKLGFLWLIVLFLANIICIVLLRS